MSASSVSRKTLLNVEQMESRLVPSATDFVGGLYQKVLHRAGGASEVNFWVQSMQNGTTGAQVTQSMLQSDEHHGMQITTLYQKNLHRAPDAAGMTSWTIAMRNGMSHDALERAILGSSEYQDAHPDDSSFVAAAYRSVLDRSPDDEGAQHWENALATGTSRDEILRSFQNSAEHLGNHVDDSYQNYLGRTESSSERDEWVQQLSNGHVTTEQQDELFLTSQEFEGAYGYDDSQMENTESNSGTASDPENDTSTDR